MAGRGGQHQGVGGCPQGTFGPVQLETGRSVVEDQGLEVADGLFVSNPLKNKRRTRVEAVGLTLVWRAVIKALGGEADTDQALRVFGPGPAISRRARRWCCGGIRRAWHANSGCRPGVEPQPRGGVREQTR